MEAVSGITISVQMFNEIVTKLERIATTNEHLLSSVGRLTELLDQKAQQSELKEVQTKLDGVTKKLYLMIGAASMLGGSFGAAMMKLLN